MYVMSWISIGNSIGLMIDVLILLWSLADSLADVNLDHLPLGFHPSLLALLDDSVASDSPGHLVESYACDWWHQKADLAPGRIFGIDTLHKCLDHYQQWVSTHETVSTPIDSQSGQDAPSGRVNCQSCVDLCTLIHDMFDEAHMMHGFLSACESAADAEMNANLRKAAGFHHHLHELALLKEIQSEPRKLTLAMAPATSSSSKNICGAGRWVRPSEMEWVSAHAQAELEHLKALLPTSYKWTWGVDITENEVLAINQKKGKGKAQHSGYIASLPDGPLQNKEWSETPCLPTISSYGRPPMVTSCDAGLHF
jgi:hypothetical protein